MFRNNSFYDVIFESVIFYSDEFKELLGSIDSPIAKDILGIEGKDIETRNNYFGLSKTNDTISFVPDRKFQEIKKEKKRIFVYNSGQFVPQNINVKYIWDELGLTYHERVDLRGCLGTIGEKIVPSRVSNNSYVAFYPLNVGWHPVPAKISAIAEVAYGDVSVEIKKNLQDIRVGRGMKTLLMAAGINKPDKDVENFVNRFKAAYDIMNDAFRYFNIIEGEEIRKYYKYDSYESSEKGSLGNSCMKHDGCREFFNIYCLNPEKVKMVLLFSDDKKHIKGRALLWKLDDNKMFLDRIYTNNDSDIDLFKEFAKKNVWYSKRNQQQGNVGMVDPSGNIIVDMHMQVTLENKKYTTYPYMDSLKYYYPDKGILTNIEPKSKDETCYKLDATNGRYRDMASCPECAGRGRITCYACDGNGTCTCYECDGNGTIRCPDCRGKGNIVFNGVTSKCTRCDGRGRNICTVCDGDDNITCSECDGDGTVRCQECN